MPMHKEAGDKHAPIWLLGDSNPRNWSEVLIVPLDPRHAARHNIWTPIIDASQDRLFRSIRQRIDTTKMYVRNAIEAPDTKPDGASVKWQRAVEDELEAFSQDLAAHQPPLLFSFGAFSFEFARRCLCETPARKFAHWGARELGEQFRDAIAAFDPQRVNLLPLLHATIARGRFIQSHEQFAARKGANYFEVVADALAAVLARHRASLPIWIE